MRFVFHEKEIKFRIKLNCIVKFRAVTGKSDTAYTNIQINGQKFLHKGIT